MPWSARAPAACPRSRARSEEHTSELQSLGLISYAVFCLKKNFRDHALVFDRPSDQTCPSLARACIQAAKVFIDILNNVLLSDPARRSRVIFLFYIARTAGRASLLPSATSLRF